MESSDMKRGVLIIAPIGDPTFWSRAKYSIDGGEYTSCSSSIALTLHNTKRYQSVILFLQALDSLICSPILGSYNDNVSHFNYFDERNHIAEELQRLFTKELLDAAGRVGMEAKVMEDNNILINEKSTVSIVVAVSQSAGEYAVSRPGLNIKTIYFGGNPTAVFAKIVNIASLQLDDMDLYLDLTHGMNYMQTMAIYAIETLKALHRTDVKIYNFAPYPTYAYKSERCFSAKFEEQKKKEEEPTLTIFDVSGLIEVSELASKMSNLMLNKEGVQSIKMSARNVVGSIEDLGTMEFMEFSRHVALAWYYISIGVITYSYFHGFKAKILADKYGVRYRKAAVLLEKAEKGVKFTLDDKMRLEYQVCFNWRLVIPTIVWRMYETLLGILNLPNIIKSSEISISMNTLEKAVLELSQKNEYYIMRNDMLKYEHGRIRKRIGKEFMKKEFDMADSELRKTILAAPVQLSSLSRHDWKRHLLSHVGITYEPISLFTVKEETLKDGKKQSQIFITLDPGKLGEDPFNAWGLETSSTKLTKK